MIQNYAQTIAQQLTLKPTQVQTTLQLLEEGNTIPFIARYRKEQTGSLDEVQIYDIQQSYHYAVQLDERKEEVTRLIAEQDKLTPELEAAIQQADKLQVIEDLYRPYKQRRRTLAEIAKENGLEPLATWLLDPETSSEKIEEVAGEYLNEEVEDVEAALAGAHEIIAQSVSDEATFREFIRKYSRYNARLESKVKDEDKDPQKIYAIYYDYEEPFTKVVPHRVLALNRAEKEDVLTVRLQLDPEPALNYMNRHTIPEKLDPLKKEYVEAAIEDSYKRFIWPAIEREMRNELTEQADRQAIDVFGENLRNLLLQPPLKGKVIMGFDPAYRTGCKLAVISATGQVLDKGVIFPHRPASAKQRQAAGPQLLKMIKDHDIDIIAIGNGTASRESEQFVGDLIQEHDLDTQFIVVNEAGASVYSASKLAREEFPDYEVEERSAVSIARRLQDPLAELIKIDPKSMGVGQYQHDVSQKELDETLDFVVNITVNQVGVDINTASVPLLQHVSGLTAATAKNIVTMRDDIGTFKNRKQIKDVKRLGPKTFEQAAGFLRIVGGENPLDQTNIHPEAYPLAERMLKEAGIRTEDLGSQEAKEALDALDLNQFIDEEKEIGLASLEDIIEGLKNPTADYRDGQEAPILRSDVLTMEDLEVGMQLEGVVRNVVDFGAFVDIGVKQDGLIHVSHLADHFVKHPSDVVAVGDILNVEVLSVDLDKERIGLRRV